MSDKSNDLIMLVSNKVRHFCADLHKENKDIDPAHILAGINQALAMGIYIVAMGERSTIDRAFSMMKKDFFAVIKAMQDDDRSVERRQSSFGTPI